MAAATAPADPAVLQRIRERGEALLPPPPGPDELLYSWTEPGRQYRASGRDDRAYFDRWGFLHVKNFVSATECDDMIAAMGRHIDAWDPERELQTFRTDEKQEEAQGSSDHFLDSADRIHFFTEPGAVDEETGKLLVGKTESLNKVHFL